MDVAHLLGQTAEPLEQQSQLLGGQVEHQPPENVVCWLPQLPQGCQAGTQQDKGCLLGPVTPRSRDGWM